MPVIEIPEIGSVEFPSSMSMDEISSAADDLYNQHKMPAEAEALAAEEAKVEPDRKLNPPVLHSPEEQSAWTKFRDSDWGHRLFGPTAMEKEAGVASQGSPSEIASKMLEFTSAPPPVKTAIKATVEALNPLQVFGPKGEAIGEALGDVAANVPLAPIAGAISIPSKIASAVAKVSVPVGTPALGLFGAEYITHLSESREAYKKAIEDGNAPEAIRIATETMLGGTLLGAGALHAASAKAEIVAPKTADAVAKSAEVLKTREEVSKNAISQPETTQLHGDVLKSEVAPKIAGEVPANVSGEGVLARGQAQEAPSSGAKGITQNPLYRGTSRSVWDVIASGGTPAPSEFSKSGTWAVNDKESASSYAAQYGDQGVLIEYKPSAQEKGRRLTDDPNDKRLQGNFTLDDVLRVTDHQGNVIYDASKSSKGGEVKSERPQEKGQAQGNVLTPAIVSGEKVFTGTSHKEILDKAKKSFDAKEISMDEYMDIVQGFADDSRHVFQTSDGKILDRAEAGKVFDEIQGNPAGTTPELQSEMLPKEPSITEKTVTDVADKFGVPWDNDPAFMARTKELTGKEHLSGLNPDELKAVRDDLIASELEPQGAIATSGPALQPSATPIPTKSPKSQREIITDLAKGLKLPIRFGRLTTSKYAGYFKKVADLIGSKKANDIPIVTHEVGHKLDAEFGIASEPSLRSELEALGDPSVPGSRSSWTPSKSKTYKLQEGVAEFVRHWLTDPVHAATTAPNTHARFEAILNANKDFGDTMRLAQSDIQTWRNAEPQARLRSHISVGENPNKTPYTVSQLTRDLVDDLHFLRLAVDDAKKLSGTELSPSENPYLLARNLRGSFGMAASFIRNGVADFKTKEVTLGTSLEDALKPVAGRINDFRDWIVAKRAQELHSQGRETGLVDSDVQATAARFDSDPAFQDAFTKIKAWNDALLKYAIDSGLVSTEGAQSIREMNQDYVPFHRVFEVGAGEAPVVEGAGVGRGLNVGKPGSLKRLSGSPRDIVDPLETMVKNAYTIITASEKQAISSGIAGLADKPGMGKWVEKIATPKEMVKVGLDKVRKQLEDAGADLTNVPDDLMMSFFQNSKQAPFGENIIKVMQNGKPEFFRLKRELSDTFHALDFDDAGTLLRMLAAPAQLLRAGVTLAPDFALSNAIRDTFGAAVLSKHGLFPFEATARGVFALLKDPKLVAEWEASGGKNSVEATYFDRGKVQKFLNEKITKDLTPAERALVVAKSPLTALRWLTGLSEEATRLGEYQTAFNDLVKGGMPEGEARRMAAFESRDRQDFSKGGSKTKPLRHITAFWNASLQANIRLAQAFKEKPLETTLKGLTYVTLAKLAEQQINWNDDDYWDRPQWERDLFFLVPIGKDAGGHTRFLRIPTPFEIGIIFGTLPGRILQSIREKNPQAVKEFPLLLAKNTVPNPIPQTLQVTFADFLSGKKGWDIWRGRQVVPESVAQLPPEMQWTEQTSLTAKKAGDLLGFPPIKIDHIISGMAGGLGKELTHQVVDRAISAATGEELAANPVIPGSRFVTTPAAVSSESIEKFYSTLEELRTSVAGAKKEKTQPQNKHWATIFENRSRRIGELRKQMRKSDDADIKQEKAERILSIARETMEQYRESKKE